MIQIAICDDEEIFVKQIHDEVKRILTEKNVEFEISDYTDGRKLLEENEFKKFDLVLLDIDMPEIGGFEIAEKITYINKKIDTIFISQFNNLVFDCFNYSPLKFVRKNKFLVDLTDAIDLYLKKRKINYRKYDFIYDGKTHEIYMQKIVYFESMKHDIYIQFDSDERKKITQNRKNPITITSLQEQFQYDGFIRVHKSFLVNYKFIKIIKKSEIVLFNNHIIQINEKNCNAIKLEYQNLLMGD